MRSLKLKLLVIGLVVLGVLLIGMRMHYAQRGLAVEAEANTLGF